MVDYKKIGLVLGFLLLLTACQSQPPTPPTPTASPIPPTATAQPTSTTVPQQAELDPDTEASIRFVVAIPDAPRVDIYVAGLNAAQQLPANIVSASLAEPAGQYDLIVMPSGKAPDPATALVSTQINVDAHEVVLCVFTGTASKFGLTRLTENVDPVPVGQARIQFMDALQGATPLSIMSDDQKVDTLQSTGQTTDSIVTPSGRHSYKLLGGDKADQSLLEQPFQLLDRQAYTMIAVGPAAGPAKLVIAPSPTTRQTQIRVINAIANSGPLDVYLGTRLIAKAIDYGKPTEWELLPAYNFDLKVFKAGSNPDSTPLFKDQVMLTPDQSGDIVVYDPTVMAHLFWENMRPMSAGGTRLTVLNAAQGTSAIQVVASGTPVTGIPPIKYGDITAGTTIQAGTYPFTFVTLNESPARTIESPSNPVNLREGVSYLYIVTGAGVNSEPFILSTDVGTIKSPIVPTATPTSLPTGVMQVRFVNATNRIGSLDLAVNGKVLFQNIAQGSASTVTQLSSADVPAVMQAAGTTYEVAKVQLAFMPGRAVMLLAVGDVSPIELLEVPDDMQVNQDVAVVQVADISPVTPPISVVAIRINPATSSAPSIGSTATPTSNTYLTFVDQITRGHVSSSYPLSSGSYSFMAVNNLDHQGLFYGGPVDLEVGKRYIITIMPDSGTGRMFIAVVDK